MNINNELRQSNIEAINFYARKGVENQGYVTHASWQKMQGQEKVSWDVNSGEGGFLGISREIDNRIGDRLIFEVAGWKDLQVKLNHSTSGENGRLNLATIRLFKAELVEMKSKLVEAGAAELTLDVMVEKLLAMEQKKLEQQIPAEQPEMATIQMDVLSSVTKEEELANKRLAEIEGKIEVEKMLATGGDWKKVLGQMYTSSEGEPELIDGEQVSIRKARRYYYEQLGLKDQIDETEAQEKGEITQD